MRIRKMQKSLKDRGAEMLQRGLRTLDELDAVEEKERREAEAREPSSNANSSPRLPVHSPSMFTFTSPFQETWGDDVETPPATSG